MPMLTHARYDLRELQLKPGVVLLVYRRDDELGRGPCFSLYRKGREALRFDLFEPAHWHPNRTELRRYYPPGLALESYADLALRDLVSKYPAAKVAASWLRQQITELKEPVG